jgi:hypothetical protein
MAVGQPKGARGEEDHYRNENYPKNSSQFGASPPEKL